MKKENVAVVPVRTFGAGNMGSILRAMRNFDFTNITAVEPLFDDYSEVEKLAAGAKEHLQYLQTSDSLEETLKRCHRVYAFSARKRKGYDVVTPHEMAQEIAAMADENSAAVLFGNETNGLNSDEIAFADKLVVIPTSEKYSSLNLSAAVMVALYEISQALEKCPDIEETVVTTKRYKLDLERAFKNLVVSTMPQMSKTTQLDGNLHAFFRKLSLNRKESRFTTTLLRALQKRIQGRKSQ